MRAEKRYEMDVAKIAVLGVMLAALSPQTAYGLREEAQLKPGNIETVSAMDGRAIEVKAEKVGENVRFVFTAEPKELALFPFVSGELTVLDGEKQIVVCRVEPTRGKGVTYTFEVAAKFLANSKFSFENSTMTPDGMVGPMHRIYWFYLSDFQSAK